MRNNANAMTSTVDTVVGQHGHWASSANSDAAGDLVCHCGLPWEEGEGCAFARGVSAGIGSKVGAAEAALTLIADHAYTTVVDERGGITAYCGGCRWDSGHLPAGQHDRAYSDYVDHLRPYAVESSCNCGYPGTPERCADVMFAGAEVATYIEAVAKIHEAYRHLVMDTPEDQEHHARLIGIADRALAAARERVSS